LTEIINQDHENKKYLPGVQLPENVVAVPDIGKAVEGATALVFVMPHQCMLIPSIHFLVQPVPDEYENQELMTSLEQSPFYDGRQTPQR
jgi:hypothetical protein